jgi:hypothetical protein
VGDTEIVLPSLAEKRAPKPSWLRGIRKSENSYLSLELQGREVHETVLKLRGV